MRCVRSRRSRDALCVAGGFPGRLWHRPAVASAIDHGAVNPQVRLPNEDTEVDARKYDDEKSGETGRADCGSDSSA